jgi:hypothetical protein
MSNEVKTTDTKLGFLSDSNGDLSSGRLIKLSSFVIAVILAFLAILVIPVAKFDIAFKIIVSFLGLAGASEVVQKITGK